MQEIAQYPQISKLRILMYERRLSAKAMAEGTGLSSSLCEKLAANMRRPSLRSIYKIEQFLDLPVWSTRAQFEKARRASRGPKMAAVVATALAQAIPRRERKTLQQHQTVQ